MQDRRDVKRAMQEKADRRAGLSKKARRDEVEESTLGPPSLPTNISPFGRLKDKRPADTRSSSETTSNSHDGAETLPSLTRQEENKKPDAKRKPTDRLYAPMPPKANSKAVGVPWFTPPSPTRTTSSPTSSAEPERNVQEPSTSIINRLDTELQQHHVTRLAQLDSRRRHILEEDGRRRAAFQEAASVLNKEIDTEEGRLAELEQMMPPEFPPLTYASRALSPVRPLSVVPLSSSPGPSRQPATRASHSSLADNERERSYLSVVIRHQYKHIATLYCARWRAVDDEAAECRRVAEILNQLEHHRQEIMFFRALEAQSCHTAPK